MTTGANTSGTNQAIVKFQPQAGCMSESLIQAIQSGLIIEFPDALSSTGSLDILTSTAVNQIVSSLVSTDEFKLALADVLASDESVRQVFITALTQSDEFSTAVDTAVNTNITSDETLTILISKLLVNETFINGIISAVTQSDTFLTAVRKEIQVAVDSLDLTACGTSNLTVDANNNVIIELEGLSASEEFWFNYHVNPPSGVVDISGHSLTGTTSSNATINFPNANPGDPVSIKWFRIRCATV